MRKKWLIYDGKHLQIIENSGLEYDHFIGEIENDCCDLSCYEVFDNGDGTYTALLSETKYADMQNRIAKENYALLK